MCIVRWRQVGRRPARQPSSPLQRASSARSTAGGRSKGAAIGVTRPPRAWLCGSCYRAGGLAEQGQGNGRRHRVHGRDRFVNQLGAGTGDADPPLILPGRKRSRSARRYHAETSAPGEVGGPADGPGWPGLPQRNTGVEASGRAHQRRCGGLAAPDGPDAGAGGQRPPRRSSSIAPVPGSPSSEPTVSEWPEKSDQGHRSPRPGAGDVKRVTVGVDSPPRRGSGSPAGRRRVDLEFSTGLVSMSGLAACRGRGSPCSPKPAEAR